MTWYHCCITLGGALKEWKYLSVNENGKQRPARYEEVKEAVEDARKKGYSVLPPCDNVDARGHCKGHEEDRENINR